ncbi:hypothetical protein GCM10010172_80010 [Paractinoplanes ferrugineus]|uniref:Uncharacterized protein n=1 Tax=Paractinoplanes ferrugineus TaxID=113564 RepID=A0A919MHT8_9ACTN|nr:hypothetical protein Afe05nite_80130 [Actinoplanes ferrugineus]
MSSHPADIDRHRDMGALPEQPGRAVSDDRDRTAAGSAAGRSGPAAEFSGQRTDLIRYTRAAPASAITDDAT